MPCPRPRTLLLPALLLALAALACNFGQVVPTPTAFVVATEPPPLPTAAPSSAPALPTASPEPSGFATFADEDLGLTFRYPAGWALQADAGFIAVASSEELLTAATFETEGAGLLVTVGPDDELFAETDSLEDALLLAVDQLDFTAEQQILAGPTLTTVGGQEAAVATVAGRDGDDTPTTIFYLTLIRHQGRAALATGVTLARAESEGDLADTPYRSTLATIVDSIQLSPPPGPTIAGTVAYGDSVQGTVPEDGAVAWTFTAAAADTISLTVEPLDETLDVVVDVLDAEGNSLLPEGPVDEAFGTETVDRLPLPAAGEYTILLSGFAGSGGEYALSLNQVTPTAAGEALLLSLDNTVAGEVGAGEVDSYLLTEVISRPLTVLVEPAPDFDVVVELYDAQGELLDAADAGFEGESERLSFTPAGGTLAVRGYGDAAGSYTLTLLDGSPAAAGSTILVEDTLTAATPEHDFPFFAPARQLVSAYVDPEPELDLVLEAWDAGDETLLERVDFSYTSEQLNFTIPEEGNYYFALAGFEGATGAYTLTLQATADTIFELARGDLVSGRLAAGTTLEYTFGLDPGAEILINGQGDDNTDLTLVVEDLDGNLLAAADDTYAGEAETLTFTAPDDAGDIFLLRVAEYGAAPGAFTLTLE